MKYIYLFLLVPVFLSSCLGYKELPVEYDYSYSGTFKKYRTFDIMRPVGMADSSMTNSLIEKSILSRMKFLGYRQTDRRPHLIVGFKMFTDSLNFNGYIQPDIEEWVKHQDHNLEYDPLKYNLIHDLLQRMLFRIRQYQVFPGSRFHFQPLRQCVQARADGDQAGMPNAIPE